MTMPEVRDELHRLAGQLPKELADRLRFLADQTKRRKSEDRAPASSQKMTPELAERIRAYATLHPQASHMAIARRYNVNPGRVSEALRGKRG